MKSINDELYKEILKILEKRNKTIYKKLLECVDIKKDNSLEKARATKSNNKIEEIKKAMIEIGIEKKREPTKYEIHKKTNIAYVTINKYYDYLIQN